MARLVVFTGDVHSNGTTAVCPPRVELDDGGVYFHSKVQAWLWERWLEFWGAVDETAERYGVEVLTILNGEIADDLRHSSTQLVSRNPEDQTRIALATLRPAIEVTNEFIVTRGSEAHSGASSHADEKVARLIGATEASADDSGRFSTQNYRGVVEGMKIDVAHHPGTGHMRPWTRGGDANRLAAMIVYRYAEQGLQAPDLTIRGHNHKPSDSADNHATRAIILPSWQLSNAFGHRLGGGWLPVGGMFMILDDAQIVHERKMFSRWPIRDWSDL